MSLMEKKKAREFPQWVRRRRMKKTRELVWWSRRKLGSIKEIKQVGSRFVFFFYVSTFTLIHEGQKRHLTNILLWTNWGLTYICPSLNWRPHLVQMKFKWHFSVIFPNIYFIIFPIQLFSLFVVFFYLLIVHYKEHT